VRIDGDNLVALPWGARSRSRWSLRGGRGGSDRLALGDGRARPRREGEDERETKARRAHQWAVGGVVAAFRAELLRLSMFSPSTRAEKAMAA